MDKFERSENGYKTDWSDGIYEVVHIVHSEKPLEEKRKYSRIVEVKDGNFIVETTIFSQLEFLEVNEVIESLPTFS